MAQIIFDTFEAFNNAKQLPLTTIVIGEPIYEVDENHLLTGRFIIDHQFTSEQVAELEANGLAISQEVAVEV